MDDLKLYQKRVYQERIQIIPNKNSKLLKDNYGVYNWSIHTATVTEKRLKHGIQKAYQVNIISLADDNHKGLERMIYLQDYEFKVL